MFALTLAAYFLCTCLVCWLILFPAGGQLLLRSLNAGRALIQQLGQSRQRLSALSAHFLLGGGKRLRNGLALARRHCILSMGAALLVLAPPLLALLTGSESRPDGDTLALRESNDQVIDILQGEQLVPPPALPPTVFMTQEVMQERPMLEFASRDWAQVDPDYARLLLTVFRTMKEKYGYDMAILEGYRSRERQDALAALGTGVTNAAAFQSWHQYGLAADCAFLRDGKLVISEKDPWAMRGYQLYGELAESLGLVWGGRWKMRDFGHTELRRAGVMKRHR